MPDQNTQEENKRDNLKTIRTFQTDIRESARKGVSPSEIVQAAQRKSSLKVIEEKKVFLSKKTIIILASVLVVGIIAGIIWL